MIFQDEPTIRESWLAELHDAVFFDLPRDADTEWDYLYQKLGPCRIQWNRMKSIRDWAELANTVCKVYRKCNWVPPESIDLSGWGWQTKIFEN